MALKCGMTKAHLDDTVGIHPTFAESYTTMVEEKVSSIDRSCTSAGYVESLKGMFLGAETHCWRAAAPEPRFILGAPPPQTHQRRIRTIFIKTPNVIGRQSTATVCTAALL